MAQTEQLPALPLEDWEATKDTLHLWVQIVGKVKMAFSAPRNHWWHVPLYVDVRGLRIDFDFVDHRLVVWTTKGMVESFALVDGLTVAVFDEQLHAKLGRLGVDVAIRETPYGVPTTTAFPLDHAHGTYDLDAVTRFWRILDWTDVVFAEFAGSFYGKQSPVHVCWHSLDIAVARFSGARAPARLEADPVTREAYLHEIISFGFWAGDQNLREPSYYSYTAPEPSTLRAQQLRPEQTRWIELGAGSLAVLPLEAVRAAPDPRLALLTFLESSYDAGATLAGWDRAKLERH